MNNEECQSLTVTMTEENNIININGIANITRPAELTVYIGGLPSKYCLMFLMCINQFYYLSEDKIFDDNIQSQLGFIQCSSCDGPPGFSGLLSVPEIDINSLVASTKQNNCIFNT